MRTWINATKNYLPPSPLLNIASRDTEKSSPVHYQSKEQDVAHGCQETRSDFATAA
jgi:hypothetical protein